ncbi:probable cyclic nucleotide-gated ion channel 16 [Nicotiana sylvestris]|uniref:probable cyclic nucleotide-gated ion channel 16 n=1 Tax=Nicotiana sylvestris TaxID=4096 RepID=UPI00388C4392
MDDRLLDAICECLVSSLNTKDTYIVREGDPVIEMLFIITGELESSTTNGGRSGFFNSITLKQGDFCGEELLTWASVPNPNFRRLHSKKLQHSFRFYSHQWRTWGACYIQAAWRRYRRKKLAEELSREESLYYTRGMDVQEDDYGHEYPAAGYDGGNASDHATESSISILDLNIGIKICC